MEKYKPLFIEESREHLSALSSLFLKLESNTDSLANSLANVADIFRHVHSIKGMAASMHYGPVADLAHTMEDAIDLYRNSGSAIPSEHIDIFLRAVDGLSAQVEAVALDADLPGFSDLSAEIKVLAQSAESILKKSEVEAKKNEPDKGQKEKTRTGTQSLLANRVIRLKILKTSRLPSVRAFMAYRKISDLTEILKTQPDVSEVKKGHLPENEFLLFIGPTPEDADLLDALKNVDEIDSIDITTIAPEAPKDSVSSPVRKVEATKAASSATIRVRTDILDTLIDNVGELLIARDQLGSLLPDVGLQPDVQVALDTLGSQVREIYSKIMTVRLTPLNTLTERYPRIVRDLARELGKEVELVINGADIELDRSILESLDEPLLHSIRNAIDHGIETPKKRIEAGKDARGKVIIEATRDRDSVIINVEDDGGGINTEQIKKIALERGVVSAQQAESLSQREAHFLICLPGFSTKDEVTGVSGRGVGMDVVRSKIEAMGGSMDIESHISLGTRFSFRLPLTLAIIHALLVEVAGRTFAIPAAKLVAVRERGDNLVTESTGHTFLPMDGNLLQVRSVADLLNLESRDDEFEQLLVIEDGRDLIVASVSKISGYQEIVVKPLGQPLEALESFSGATVLADGVPVLIVDIPRALRASQ